MPLGWKVLIKCMSVHAKKKSKALGKKESVSAQDSLRSNLVRALNDFQLIGKYFLKNCQKVQENQPEKKTTKLVCIYNPFAPLLLEDVMVIQLRSRDCETNLICWISLRSIIAIIRTLEAVLHTVVIFHLSFL